VNGSWVRVVSFTRAVNFDWAWVPILPYIRASYAVTVLVFHYLKMECHKNE
jgi:hypothetical protein